MAVTISLYNHTRQRFLSGANASGDTYKLKLLTAATFDATHTTLAATGGTETSNTGYTTGGETLANVAVTATNTNEAKFDADDVELTASGSSLSAAYGIIYNDTDADDPPVAFIDFDGTVTAGDGTAFNVVWNANGIFTLTAPA